MPAPNTRLTKRRDVTEQMREGILKYSFRESNPTSRGRLKKRSILGREATSKSRRAKRDLKEDHNATIGRLMKYKPGGVVNLGSHV